MYNIEAPLTPLDKEFLQQCSALGKRILAIPGLPDPVVRIFREATPSLLRINNKRDGIQLSLIEYDHYSEANSAPHLKTLDTPTLEQILTQVRAEVSANKYITTYWSLGSCFHPTDWRVFTNEDILLALFPDYPRLVMNISLEPADSVSSGLLKQSDPTVEDILARKDSRVSSLWITAYIRPEEFTSELPSELEELTKLMGD